MVQNQYKILFLHTSNKQCEEEIKGHFKLKWRTFFMYAFMFSLINYISPLHKAIVAEYVKCIPSLKIRST